MTRSSHVLWFLIFWLFMLSAVSLLDRVNISIAGSPLAAACHLTNVQLGWVFGCFLAGYALFQTPGRQVGRSLRPAARARGGVIWWESSLPRPPPF